MRQSKGCPTFQFLARVNSSNYSNQVVLCSKIYNYRLINISITIVIIYVLRTETKTIQMMYNWQHDGQQKSTFHPTVFK